MADLRTAWLEADLPPLAASLLVYVAAFCVGFVLNTLAKLVVPRSLRPFFSDFFKTLVICTYPYGHGLVRETYGHVGYILAVVPLVVLTVNVFPDGVASPLALFMEFLNHRLTAINMLLRVGVQTLGGFASYHLARLVWYFEMHHTHVAKLNENGCITDLTVPLMVGFLIEMAGVTFDTLISFITLFKNEQLDLAVKVLNGAILVSVGVRMTGMYMHPVMASGLTFGCHGTSAWEHLFVYWASAFIGCYLAFMVHKFITSARKTHKKRLSEDEFTNNNRAKKTEQNANYMKYPETTARQRNT